MLAGGDVLGTLLELRVLGQFGGATVVFEGGEVDGIWAGVAEFLQQRLDPQAFFDRSGEGVVLSLVGRESDVGVR